MKKFILIALFPVSIILLLVIILFGGTAGGAIIAPPATPEDTYKYQYIGSELGVPWEIVLLVDTFDAEKNGKSGIGEYNPLSTSLEFCILNEEVFTWVEYEKPEKSEEEQPSAAPTNQPSIAPTESPEESQEESEEPTGDWELTGTITYVGKNSILDYIGHKDNLEYQDISSLVTEVNDKAASKSTSDKKYEVYIGTNPDYEGILRNTLKFDEESVGNIMDLYESHYLMYMYGYDSNFGNFEIELPPLVVGDVTRMDLARTASGLMGLPYLFGGKSLKVGAPTNGLDCSGFVDWVYFQCFGKGVSGGKIPDGISMAGTAMQFYASREISASELKIGDLGFYYDPAKLEPGKVNHVGIYIGKINGIDAFIHSGGSFFGYDGSPTGRVGISVNQIGVVNSTNPIVGGTFSPGMKGSAFKFFRRPNYQFKGD